MTNLQTPLRSLEQVVREILFATDRNGLFEVADYGKDAALSAGDLVAPANVLSKFIDEYQAMRFSDLQAKLTEAERTRDLYQQAMGSMENQFDRLEEAATAITPYPEGYRPTAWEAVFYLPGELRAARERAEAAEAKLAAVREPEIKQVGKNQRHRKGIT